MMFITKKSENYIEQDQVNSTLAILKKYADLYIESISTEIKSGEDEKLIEFLNDFETSRYEDDDRSRIIHKEGYKHDEKQSFHLKNSADIILKKIESNIEDQDKNIKDVVNDIEIKENFNKYIKDKVAFLIFKYFENKTNKMLEELGNVKDNKEKFEKLYEEHKKLFLVMANVCSSYRECAYEEKGQFVRQWFEDDYGFLMKKDNGFGLTTCGDVRKSAIDNYFNTDNSLVKNNSLVKILKKPHNYFLSGVAVERGNREFNQLCRRLNNAFTLEKLEFDLQDENKINTKDLFQLYNKNIDRKGGEFNISERNIAKFLKKYVGHYGFKRSYRCDCVTDFKDKLSEAIENRKDNIINDIKGNINNYQNDQLEKLKEKLQKLMKKTTLLNTKVKILTELYLNGKEGVSKQDEKNIKKDIRELIKNKKTKNFSNLLSTMQEELDKKENSRENVVVSTLNI